MQPKVARSECPLEVHSIKWSVKSNSLQIVGPDDFAMQEILPGIDRNQYVITPYCFGVEEKGIYYALTEKQYLSELLGMPFLYGAQRKLSQKMAFVSLESCADDICNGKVAFVFSPGRTGSTLLSRLLGAAGHLSLSEPDIFTQLCTLPEPKRGFYSKDEKAILLRSTVSAFQKINNFGLYVKLRAPCILNVEQIVLSVPGCAAVFLFRNHQEWALSRHVRFREQPKHLATLLAQSVRAVERVKKVGIEPTVILYEDLLTYPFATVAKLLGDDPVDGVQERSAIEKILEQDSQAGTKLSREHSNSTSSHADFMEAFQLEWRAVCPNVLVERYGLRGYNV